MLTNDWSVSSLYKSKSALSLRVTKALFNSYAVLYQIEEFYSHDGEAPHCLPFLPQGAKAGPGVKPDGLTRGVLVRGFFARQKRKALSYEWHGEGSVNRLVSKA